MTLRHICTTYSTEWPGRFGGVNSVQYVLGTSDLIDLSSLLRPPTCLDLFAFDRNGLRDHPDGDRAADDKPQPRRPIEGLWKGPGSTPSRTLPSTAR